MLVVEVFCASPMVCGPTNQDAGVSSTAVAIQAKTCFKLHVNCVWAARSNWCLHRKCWNLKPAKQNKHYPFLECIHFWEPCLPICLWTETCYDPGEMNHAVRTEPRQAEYEQGSNVTYSCDSCFEIVGKGVITCKGNRTWTEMSFCKSKPKITKQSSLPEISSVSPKCHNTIQNFANEAGNKKISASKPTKSRQNASRLFHFL